MSTSDALPGEGVKFYYSTDAGSTYVELARVEEVDGVEVSLAAIKTAHLASTVHTKRRSRIVDAGKITLKLQVNVNNTGHKLMISKVNTPATDDVDDYFKIVFPDGQVVPAHVMLRGFVSKYKISGEKIEGNLMMDVDIELNAVPAFVDGAAS